ncbi:MAG: Ni/Fe-hydrogenase, b-type cytochrome subunit, partial [Gallionellaceae bacterium]|nr:Ni/Fe-hydrogenase, b-type cytochrome subunit [Gallionellaceae bacterium]
MEKKLRTYGFDDDAPAEIGGKAVTSIYVYQAPVRIWHWLNALSIVVLCVTGFLIGKPLYATPIGEASDHFLMGYIRFAHFTAAYVFAVGLIFRIWWAFFGNHYSRELFIVPVWDAQWWREVLHEIRWYLFLARKPHKYVGHNSLAQCAMFFFILLCVFMVFSGFALYSEGLGRGSWADHLFGWMIPLFGDNSLALHSWH